MRKSIVPITALLLAALLTGCGGASSLLPNSFAGSYTGTLQKGADVGNASLTIGSDGTTTGTMLDTTTTTLVTINGTVNVLGVVTGTSVSNALSGTTTGTFTQTQGGLNGTITTVINGVTSIYTLTLTPTSIS